MPKTAHTIFLVDDDPVFLGTARHFLQKNVPFPIEVKCYKTGSEALMDAQLKPAIAVLDMFLGDEHVYNLGIQLIEEFKKATPRTQLVFLTVFNNQEVRQRALNMGTSAYLIKDQSQFERLAETIIKLLRESELSTSIA